MPEEAGCGWRQSDPLLCGYHDREWGIPVHDDRRQFEHLTLEAMQCGLSWLLILKKREAIREAFADFDPKRVAAFTEEDVTRILSIPNMIRSAPKIRAIIKNAQVFLEIEREYGSFDSWLWSFTGNKTLVYPDHQQNCPASNELSDRVAAELKKRGMRYLGSITLYSHMQAVGLINDHAATCPQYAYINTHYPIAVQK